MHLVDFNALQTIVGGQVICQTNNLPIRELVVDGRTKVHSPFSVFFAIKNGNQDGHNHLQEAYRQGIRQFVIQETSPYVPSKPWYEANMIQVPSTLRALQRFAAWIRSSHTLPVLAITGSYGKTMVKEWLYQFLSAQYHVVSNPHSHNSQVGASLSVSRMQPKHTYGVFEAGGITLGEMEKLRNVIQPTEGLFLNIESVHSQGCSNTSKKIQEKAILFKQCQTIYYCKDHKLIDRVLQDQYHGQIKCVTWSLANHPWADYRIVHQKMGQGRRYKISIHTCQNQWFFYASVSESIWLENVTHCLVYLLDRGLNPIALQETLKKLRLEPMGISIQEGINDSQILEDTHCFTLANLETTLDFIHEQRRNKKTVILCNIMEPALSNFEVCTHINDLLTHYGINRLIGIGPNLCDYKMLFSIKECLFCATFDDLTKHRLTFQNECIVLPCSHSLSEHPWIRSLQKQTHSTVLAMNMRAIQSNVTRFRERLNTQTKIMGIVKASAYGTSPTNLELVASLERYGIDYLGVACLDEGICLRKQGIIRPIMVMNPSRYCLDGMVAYGLEPEVYSVDFLKELISFVNKMGVSNLTIHLKLETGMHRLGLYDYELETVCALLHKTPRLQVVGILSHLADAQNKEQDAFTLLQIKRFIRMATQIEQTLKIQTIKHILNSHGTLRFPEFQMDMVRIGIGLYGIGVAEPFRSWLTPASTLKTRILQIKRITQGSSVGYERRYIAKKDGVIAVLPIGYGDGLSRTLGCGRGHFFLQGQPCPIVGNLCMDTSMIDVSGLDAQVGDWVIIFNPQYAVDDLAKKMGTVPYELLTQIGSRIKRVYLK